jgi:uncharacterized membrane protein
VASDGITSRAFLYGGGKMTDLGAPFNSRTTFVTGLNRNGQMVGYALLPGAGAPGQQAYLYSAGKWTPLGGTLSTAWAINDAGQVVGQDGHHASRSARASGWI